jgi:micrococcal nuclease
VGFTAAPPPDPSDRRSLVSGTAATLLGRVRRLGRWQRITVWVLGCWVLLPLWIVVRTRASTPGVVAAGAVFVTLTAALLGGGPPRGDTDPPLPAAGASEQVSAPDASPAPTRATPTPDPSTADPSASPPDTLVGTGASPGADDGDAPRDTGAGQSGQAGPVPASEDDDASVAAPTGSAGPRGDDAPVVRTGRVVDVVDGDTFDLADGTRVRLAIADTPEVFGGLETCGRESSAFTARFLAGQTVALYRPTDAPTLDRFDRALGEVVRVTDGASLNVALVRAGLARVDERFTGEDPDLAARMRTAARDADDPGCRPQGGDEAAPPPVVVAPPPSGGGEPAVSIAAIEYDGPGNDVQAGVSEHVVLSNTGGSDVDLAGWTIIDLADNRVVIGAGTLVAGGRFTVWSGPGSSSPRSDWYAGRGQAYLNNSGGDTIMLRDAAGNVVDTASYSS